MQMPTTIKRLTGVGTGGTITAVGESQPERVVTVPSWAIPLLKDAAIVPPQSGKLDSAETSRKLASLSIADRIRIRNVLYGCDLL
jgi:hypothetical protein